MIQFVVCTSLDPITGHLCVEHLSIHKQRLCQTWNHDTFISNIKSLLGNNCDNSYIQVDLSWVAPIYARHGAGSSLVGFTDNMGITKILWIHGSDKCIGYSTCFSRKARRMRIKNFIIEQGCRKQNHASKRRIGILLTSCNKLTEKKKYQNFCRA